MPEEPEVNSLARFKKKSERLELESYSHCEVPAGCGGVVFRWRRGDRPIELLLHLFSPYEPRVWVDGEELASSRIDLAAGDHVLALHFPDADLSATLFMLAAQVPRKARREERRAFRTLPGGAWQYRLTEPPEGWSGDSAGVWQSFAPGRGDGWQRLMPGPAMPQPTAHGPARWRHHACTSAGAGPLAVPGGTGRGPVWVRYAFLLNDTE